VSAASGNTGEPPDADPHVRWCGRGRCDAAPYPIPVRMTGQIALPLSGSRGLASAPNFSLQARHGPCGV
jgi:hypothetical protein